MKRSGSERTLSALVDRWGVRTPVLLVARGKAAGDDAPPADPPPVSSTSFSTLPPAFVLVPPLVASLAPAAGLGAVGAALARSGVWRANSAGRLAKEGARSRSSAGSASRVAPPPVLEAAVLTEDFADVFAAVAARPSPAAPVGIKMAACPDTCPTEGPTDGTGAWTGEAKVLAKTFAKSGGSVAGSGPRREMLRGFAYV